MGLSRRSSAHADWLGELRTALIILAVLATASTSTASYLVVTSKDIKNGTIQPIDLSAKSKQALRGRIGPRGPQGPAGQQGLPGAQGERGLRGVFRSFGPFISLAPGEEASSTATCPSGIAVDGGFRANTGPHLVAIESMAYNDTVWIVQMKNLGSYTDSFNAQVVCAY